MKLITKVCLLFCFLNHYTNSYCQTTNISGIINDYTPVTLISVCSVDVANSSSFSIGDRVLIIQMKGVTIDVSNTPTFGDITALNDCGNYEFCHIQTIIGNTIYFTSPLQRSYVVSGIVQLIRVPQYANAIVTAPLTCPNWNGATGGVLVLECSGSLTLNDDIDVTSKGFILGNVSPTGYSCPGSFDYFYPSTSYFGAEKGEGIAINIASRANGMGKLANGGGGGNNVNAGGGGGANFGNGGNGGNNWAGCPLVDIGGRGGQGLPYSNVLNKIFLGGAGGGGQQNDLQATPGTNGGGIVILRANSIIGNSKTIGVSAANVLAGGADGTGGAGSGGTLVLDVNAYTTVLNINAKGGDGAFPTLYTQGASGGGGGGVIWSKTPLPVNVNYTVLGGIRGIQGSGSQDGSAGGLLNGLTIVGTPFTFSTTNNITVSSSNFSICTGNTTSLSVSGANTYTWNANPSLNTTNNYTVIATPTITSTYTLVGTFANGCINTQTTTVIVSPLPIITVNPITICSGQQNATLTANGASTYTWSSGQNTNSIIESPTVTTTYTVLGIDGNGCSNYMTSTIFVNQSPSVSITQTNVTCFGFNDGIASVSTGSNSSSYYYSWSTNPIQLTPTATNLSAGVYSVVLTSTICTPSGIELITNGDFEAGNINFTNTYSFNSNCSAGGFLGNSSQPDYFDVNPITTCYGLTDRSGGNGKVLHFVDLQGANSGATMWQQTVNVSANKYYTLSFWVYDNSGCSYQTQGSNFDIYINNVLIQNSNTGGCGLWYNKTFSWSSGSNTQAIIELRSGLTNFNAGIAGMDPAFDDISFQECISLCPTTSTVQITEPLPVVISVNSPSICVGQQTAVLMANGANTYTWSAGLSATTGSMVIGNPLATTVYTVLGANTNNCFSTITTTIIVNELPNILVNNSNTTICVSQQTATLTANGANTYTWSSGQNTISIVQSPSITTTYTVFGIDGNGCNNYTTTTIQVNVLPIISANSATICVGQQTATLTANGANTYTWSTNQNTISIVQSPSITTTYTVIGTDNNACFTSAITTVSVLPVPTITVSSVIGNTVCPLSTFTLNSNGANSYTYIPAPIFSNVTGSSVIISPLNNITYTVIGNANGCLDTSEISIYIASNPTITVTSVTICSSESANLVANGGVSYTWSPSATLNTILGNNVNAAPLATTVYSISGSSSLGCIATTTTEVAVIATPSITITKTPNTLIKVGETVQISANSTVNNYTWSPSAYLSCINCATPIASTSVTTTYCVVSENTTCTSTVCITIDVEIPCATNETLGLPNAFSPNGDGINDEYCLQGWNDCVESFSLSIFDRWGQKVFNTTDPSFCWDGTKNGKLLDPAVFIYYAKATLKFGSDFNKKGNITLIK